MRTPLGIVQYHLGDVAAGERALREALDSFEEYSEQMARAAVRRELADLLTKTNCLPEAWELLDEAEAIYEELDDRMGKAATSNSFGAWYLASGDPCTARGRHNEALRLALEIASSWRRRPHSLVWDAQHMRWASMRRRNGASGTPWRSISASARVRPPASPASWARMSPRRTKTRTRKELVTARVRTNLEGSGGVSWTVRETA